MSQIDALYCMIGYQYQFRTCYTNGIYFNGQISIIYYNHPTQHCYTSNMIHQMNGITPFLSRG
jgi:hypothetical protein